MSSISWEEAGQSYEADWRSENGIAAHKKVLLVDDTLTADAAYQLACEGTAMLCGSAGWTVQKRFFLHGTISYS